MSYSTPADAGGIPYNLVGANEQPSPSVVAKFSTALLAARRKLTHASFRVLAMANEKTVPEREIAILLYCFNPKGQAEFNRTYMRLRAVLTETFSGLMTKNLNICEADPAKMPDRFAQGYVTMLGPIRGDIHVLFSPLAADLPRLLIHEATHKFSGTDDTSSGGDYLHEIDTYLNVISHGISGNPKIKNANALNNADSFAYFADKLS